MVSPPVVAATDPPRAGPSPAAPVASGRRRHGSAPRWALLAPNSRARHAQLSPLGAAQPKPNQH
jgi:hypothetical protein